MTEALRAAIEALDETDHTRLPAHGPASRDAAAGALPGLEPRPVHRESQNDISVCEVTAAPGG